MRRLASCLAVLAGLLAASTPVQANTYTVVFDANVSWSQARTAAITAGGYLATITSASEQAAVEQAIALAGPPREGAFWINARETTECTYVWDNGESRCYGNFYFFEPNNGSPGEDRVHLLWSNDLSRRGRWNDAPQVGIPGLGDISRLGYVIEVGPTGPLGQCGPGLPVSHSSACNTPPPGSTTYTARVSGSSTGPGIIQRTITDITEPNRSGPGNHTLATYIVTCSVPGGTSATAAALSLRDSINFQAGGAGFVASMPPGGDAQNVQMYRASGNFSVSDNCTAPGLTIANINSGPGPGPGGGGVQGPIASPVGIAMLLVLLAGIGAVALRTRS
ncbi:MAG TPA: lectin-like protein [Candidatus Eisenbacteria bacterium]|nr:lectin-like protein [Candidatus Eisenbacteria bacterium]